VCWYPAEMAFAVRPEPRFTTVQLTQSFRQERMISILVGIRITRYSRRALCKSLYSAVSAGQFTRTCSPTRFSRALRDPPPTSTHRRCAHRL
jgi:hypothetical protein